MLRIAYLERQLIGLEILNAHVTKACAQADFAEVYCCPIFDLTLASTSAIVWEGGGSFNEIPCLSGIDRLSGVCSGVVVL